MAVTGCFLLRRGPPTAGVARAADPALDGDAGHGMADRDDGTDPALRDLRRVRKIKRLRINRHRPAIDTCVVT